MRLPTPSPSSPGRKNFSPWKRARTLVGALLLVGFIGGMVVACGETAPASPTATATTGATATPTSVSPSAYKAAVLSALNSIGKAAEKFATDCNEKDITSTVCHDDLQAVHDAVANAQTTLDQHPAPPCLKAADARIREAMTDYHDGITLIQQGAENGDTGTIQVGTDLLNDGNNELSHAQVEISQASC